jgi:biopolymer transport protein ExbD
MFGGGGRGIGVVAGGVVVAASALAAAPDLLFPTATNAEPVTTPYDRITLTADAHILHDGLVPIVCLPTDCGPDLPTLLPALSAFHVAHADGMVLLAGDRRVTFQAARAVLATLNAAGIADVGFQTSPEGAALRALRVSQSTGTFDPLAEIGQAPPPPLLLHLTASGVVVLRDAKDGVRVPRDAGGLDLRGLGMLVAEDRRLYPGEDLVVVNTDDGVALGDTVAAVDLARTHHYGGTLLAGGPATPPWSQVVPPALAGTPELPKAVTFHADGGVDLRAADGSLELVRHATVEAYEAHCDAATCDLVLRTAARRVAIGSQARTEALRFGLFGRSVYVYEGRLGDPQPPATGDLSPLVQLPGGRPAGTKPASGAPTPTAPAPILLGALPKKEIDAVIKRNMEMMRTCYDAALDRDRALAGKITIKFVIAADGTVSSSAVKSTDMADPVFQTCMTMAFKSMRFPLPEGGGIVIVSYPFVFSPG